MNVFKYIVDYFKKIRSRFRKSSRNKEVIQRIEENKNKQLKEVDKKLQTLSTQEDNKEEVEKAIKEKTSIEIGQELPKVIKEPVFDLVEIENEVKLLNQKLFEIDVQKQKISSIQVSKNLKSNEVFDRLEKLVQEIRNENSIQPNTDIFKGFDESKTEVDSFFEEFKLIKIYRKREEKRKREEQVKRQKVNAILSQIDQFLNLGKLDRAKQNIRIAEREIKGIRSSQQKTKLKKRLSKLVEVFRKKEVEAEAKRQREELKRKKEEAERKRKEDERKREEERKKGIIVNEASKNAVIEQFQIKALYHMTAISNLESILRNGLLSHSEAHRNRFVNTDISDNEVNDRRQRKEPVNRRRIHDYVPFYFNPKNPMLYRRKDIQDDIVILEVDKRLIYQKDNLFTDGNAASNPTRFYNNLNGLANVDWTGVRREFWHDYPDGKRIRCAEVLVYPKMPSNYIYKIHSNNITTMEKARNTVRDCGLEIQCVLTSKLYF